MVGLLRRLAPVSGPLLIQPNALPLSAIRRLEARKAEWRERAALMAENGMDEAGNRISGAERKRKKGGDGAAGGGKKQRKGA